VDQVVNLELATANNSEELCDFFNGFQISGLIDLKVQRLDNYFAPYLIQSDTSRTYFLREKGTQKILAAASFVLQRAYLGSDQVRIAHAMDLRVKNSRSAIVEWSHHFLPVLAEIRREMDAQYLFSTINNSESSAFNAFIRPRKLRRPLPRYFLYRKFRINSLHGQFPWAPRPLTSIRVTAGHPGLLSKLATYIAEKSRFRTFSTVWDQKSLEQKISRLPGLSLSDFLVAFDANDKIIGCLAPWKIGELQKWLPLSYSLSAHNFRQFLKFGRLFGWTRPLTKPVASTGRENPLQMQAITHLHIDNEDVLETLLWEAFHRIGPQEFLVYAQVENDFRLNPPRSWVSASLPYSMYSILNPNEEVPDFLHPGIAANPEIEAAYTMW